MKKVNSILLLLFILGCYNTPNSFAQFAIVKDSIRGEVQAYTQFRGSDSFSLNIPNNSVVYLYPRSADIEPWRYAVYYKPGGETQDVYIREDYLFNVDELDLIDTERLSSHGQISFKNDSIRVVVSTSNIVFGDKSIKLAQNGRFSVDGKNTYGAYRSFPKVGYRSIVVTINGRNYSVPKKQLNYLFAPSLIDTTVYVDPNTGIIYVVATNGDTNAIYYALWSVDKKGNSNVFVKDWRIM